MCGLKNIPGHCLPYKSCLLRVCTPHLFRESRKYKTASTPVKVLVGNDLKKLQEPFASFRSRTTLSLLSKQGCWTYQQQEPPLLHTCPQPHSWASGHPQSLPSQVSHTQCCGQVAAAPHSHCSSIPRGSWGNTCIPSYFLQLLNAEMSPPYFSRGHFCSFVAGARNRHSLILKKKKRHNFSKN